MCAYESKKDLKIFTIAHTSTCILVVHFNFSSVSLRFTFAPLKYFNENSSKDLCDVLILPVTWVKMPRHYVFVLVVNYMFVYIILMCKNIVHIIYITYLENVFVICHFILYLYTL